MKIKFKSILIYCLSFFLFISCADKKNVLSFEAMNTYMSVQSFGKNAYKANELLQKRIQTLEASISTTKETSYIYKLNNYSNENLQVDDDTYSLINYALSFAYKSDGALNIALYPVISAWGFTTNSYRVPEQSEINQLLKNTDYTKILLLENNTISLAAEMKIDLGSIGKGFAGDEAIKILKENGIKSALLDLGGNIQALGLKPDGTEWTIGIKNPWDGSVAAGVKINSQAVITSGGYERYFTDDDGHKYIHIFNSKNGRPVENEIVSVTIISESGLYADALSTSLFVMGLEKAFDFWKVNKDFEMIILTEDKKIYLTPAVKEKTKLIYDFSDVCLIE